MIAKNSGVVAAITVALVSGTTMAHDPQTDRGTAQSARALTDADSSTAATATGEGCVLTSQASPEELRRQQHIEEMKRRIRQMKAR